MQLARDHGGDITGKRNADGSVSPYELNLNYFDAVNNPNADEPEELQVRRFLVSQAIPMALMGIPGIYIHSLLGSRNDLEGVRRSGRARSINRAQLEITELETELQNPGSLRARVFAGIKNLLDIRAGQSALHPDAGQVIRQIDPRLFAVERHNPETGQCLLALHNVSNETVRLNDASMPARSRDLLAPATPEQNLRELQPYQVRWISWSTGKAKNAENIIAFFEAALEY